MVGSVRSAALAAVGVFVAGAALAAGTPAKAGPAATRDRPNILLITTDDQSLTDLAHMPRTRRLLARRGVSLTGLSPHPLCCPARAEILSGQFAQNNGVRTNHGPYGGYKALDPHESIATWLRRAGYSTVFVGKFLNGYSRADAIEDPTPGWTDWNALAGSPYAYRDFVVNHNGTLRRHRTYQTDYLTNLAVAKVERYSRTRRPFLIWQSYTAPHVGCPASPCWSHVPGAARHAKMFTKAQLPGRLKPSFNEADVSDHIGPIGSRKRLTPDDLERLRNLHRSRLRSLQAVDEGVQKLVRKLADTRELANTLVIFTSDNGFLLGEHRYRGKVLHFEEALRVPMLMRGPGLPAGVRRSGLGTTVDIAPTLLAAARTRPTHVTDGRNLLPVARRGAASWETILIQAGPRNLRVDPEGWYYRGVRTARYTYITMPSTGERALYDRRRDPYQIANLAGESAYAQVEEELARRTELLQECAGQNCRATFGPVPGPSH